MDVTTSYYNRCRLCIAEARLSLQLFETEAIRLDLVDKIRSYLSINVSLHDGLPQQICYECLSRIELFHSYKQSCLESQHTLKHWNLFCDGGSVPQDVDIFSGRSMSTDALMDAHSRNNAAMLAKRKSAESMVQHLKSIEVTPTRKSSYLGSPVINKSSTATPPKTKSMNTALVGQIMEISTENRTRSLTERVSLDDSATRRQINNSVPQNASLNPGLYLNVTKNVLNYTSNIESGTKSPKQMSRKSLQSSTVETAAKLNAETKSKRSRSPSPRQRRSTTPMREVKSSITWEDTKSLVQEERKQSSDRYQDVMKISAEKDVKPSPKSRSPSPHPMTRSQTPLKEVKSSPPAKTMPLMQKQLTSPKSAETGMSSRSQSLDRFKSSEKNAGKSSPTLPSIQIISIESLAPTLEKSNVKLSVYSPENDSRKGKGKRSSTASTSDKGNLSQTPVKCLIDGIDKSFASTISEMVKQRKRSNSGSAQICNSVKKPRKPRTKTSSAITGGSVDTNKENSNANLTDWMSDNVNDSSVTKNNQEYQGESDARSIQSIDDSTQALLRLLESDDDEDYFLSDGENFESDNSRPGTPSPRNPMNAYVKVEKLARETDSNLYVQTDKELNVDTPRGRKGRQRQQSNQYRLVKVVKDEETGRERYKCLKCGSLLSNKGYIKEHMKIHTGDKEFKCQKCPKAFRNNYMLKAHDAVHLKEKKYTCNTCGSKFVQRDRLRQHFRVHMAEMLECVICGHKTNQKTALRRHMRIHTGERPFECEFCGGKYTDRSTYINHRRIHTGERPFSCKECGKTFSRIVYLQGHMRSHSDERPFPCHLCPSSFKTKAHLVKHLSSVHKDLMRSVVTFIKEERSV